MTHLQSLAAENRLKLDDIMGLFDHALLHPTLTDAQLRSELADLCPYRIATVCIKPHAVSLACEVLQGTQIGVGTVIGFPHGSPLPQVKAVEAERAFADGASEVDMVVNVGKVLGGDWGFVREDIRAVLDVARVHKGILKVIFETDYLTEDRDKIRLCEICSELKVDFVKTSTGFGFVKEAGGKYSYQGATDHDLRLMRSHSAADIGVKASGGVRSLEDVLRAIEIGVTRIGTSSTQHIYQEALKRFGGEPIQVAVPSTRADSGY